MCRAKVTNSEGEAAEENIPSAHKPNDLRKTNEARSHLPKQAEKVEAFSNLASKLALIRIRCSGCASPDVFRRHFAFYRWTAAAGLGLRIGDWIAVDYHYCGPEEEMLRRELDGYNEYMKKVKWRLIPFIF